ncbi:MAG: hypothetical protein IBJ15_10910 [Alphaproteobacteria bacterium]|nr:hypothetical protein [Alphaproteobacteria bacterium]
MISRRSALAGLALFAAPAYGQARPSIFAPQIDSTAHAWFVLVAKLSARIHRTSDAIRYHAADGSGDVVIARLDRDKAWLVAPALRVAFETDLTGLGLPPAILRGRGFQESPIRATTVDGVPASQLRVKRDAADVALDATALVDRRGVLWRLEGTGTVGGQPGRLDWNFEDVTPGRFDAALFEAPADIRVVPVAGETLLLTLRRFGMIR